MHCIFKSIIQSIRDQSVPDGNFEQAGNIFLKVVQVFQIQIMTCIYSKPKFVGKFCRSNKWFDGFFFFDGEQLREHFKGNSNKYLKEKIEQVSRTSVLNELLERLTAYNESLEQKIRKSANDQELNQLELEYRKERERLDGLITKKEELDRNQIKNASLKSDIIAKITKFGNSNRDVESLNKQYRDTESLLDELKEKLNARKTDYQHKLLDTAPLVLLKNKLQASIDIISTAVKNKEAPAPVTEDFLKRLIKDEECICGISLTKNPSCKKMLISVLEDVRGIKSVDYGEGQFYLARYLSEANSFNENISPLAKEIKDLEKKIGETVEILDGLKKTRESSENKNLGNLQVELSLIDGEINRDNLSLGGLNTDINQQKFFVADAERNYELKKKRAGVAQGLIAKQQKTKSVIDSIKTFRKYILERNQQTLVKKTEEYLRMLLTQKSEYEIEKVEIDDQYELRLVSKVNPFNNLRHTLSAGETQIFVLSFAAALREVTGYNAPLIIDTPLGKIDNEYRVIVVEALPKIFKKTQMIFLVTSSEYSNEVELTLNKNFPKSKKYRVEKSGINSELNKVLVMK